MRIIYCLIFYHLCVSQVHLSVLDAETKQPVSGFKYTVDYTQTFVAETHHITLEKESTLRIQHIAYQDTILRVEADTILYLRPKIYHFEVDVVQKRFMEPGTESIDLDLPENAVTTHIESLIENIPSAYISDYGGGGSSKVLRIRGASDRHSLILFDGIPINAMQNSWARLEIVPLANASAVDLYTTGNSGVFGANALAGALNISFIPKFTDKTSVQFTHSLTSFERNRKEYTKERTPVPFLNLGNAEIDGFDVAFKLNQPIHFLEKSVISLGGLYEEGDNDYLFKNGNFYRRIGNNHSRKNLNVGFNTSWKNLQVADVFLYGLNNAGTPGTASDYKVPRINPAARQIDKTLFHLLKASYFINRSQSLFLSTAYSDQALEYKVSNTHRNQTYTHKFEYHFSNRYYEHISYLESRYAELHSSSISHAERWTNSYAMHNTFHFYSENSKELDGKITLRFDRFKDKLTLSLPENAYNVQEFRLSFKADRFHWWLAFTKNYSFPTFNDLFWPKSGNPNLDVEYSKNTETGVAYTVQTKPFIAILENRYFYNRFENLIRWIPYGSQWTPVNLKSVEQLGTDAHLNLKFIQPFQLETIQKIHLKLSYLYNRNQEILTKENSSSQTARQLAFSPVHTFHSDLSVFSDIGYYKLSFHREGEQLAPNGEIENTARNLWNFFFQYAFELEPISLKPFFEIKNLMNVYYTVRPGYPMPNRTFKLGLQLNY